MFSLPIPSQETGLKQRHFVLCVYIHIYIYNHYVHGVLNNNFQFSFPLALALCAEANKFESYWGKILLCAE